MLLVTLGCCGLLWVAEVFSGLLGVAPPYLLGVALLGVAPGLLRVMPGRLRCSGFLGVALGCPGLL